MPNCLSCGSCLSKNELVQLKCDHTFCWKCISGHLQTNIDTKIKCPDKHCTMYIRDSIIRQFLCDEDIDKYEKMSLDRISKKHKCVLKECPEYIMYTDANIQYECPFCKLYNCIPCNASHPNLSCIKFKQLNESARINNCQAEKARAQRIIREKKFQEIKDLEEQDFFTNNTPFLCPICNLNVRKGEGIKLRNCWHLICNSCFCNIITSTAQIPVKCPTENCTDIILDQDIITNLSGEDFQSYMLKYNESIKRNNPHFLQCLSPNCDFFYDYSKKLESFTCSNCKSVNCVKCRAVHPKESCTQYQNKLKKDPNYIAMKKHIDAGKIINCPGCHTIIQKEIGGCNAIQCPNCLLEICWILKIPRWGPKGRGDESGGCKCRVDKPCHPQCLHGCLPDD